MSKWEYLDDCLCSMEEWRIYLRQIAVQWHERHFFRVPSAIYHIKVEISLVPFLLSCRLSYSTIITIYHAVIDRCTLRFVSHDYNMVTLWPCVKMSNLKCKNMLGALLVISIIALYHCAQMGNQSACSHSIKPHPSFCCDHMFSILNWE